MNSNFEEIDDVASSQTFNQLGILCLDGSGSMTLEGNRGQTLAESVNLAVREFLGFFKKSSIVNNFSIAVITFDSMPAIHTPITRLVDIEDFANYDPTVGHGGRTNIGAALEKAEEIAKDFLNKSGASGIPSSVSVVVMSDGMCDYPQETKRVAERLKKIDKITICSSFFSSKHVGDSDRKQAQQDLQDIASGVNFYKTTYDAEDLRKFFIASMSTSKYGEPAAGTSSGVSAPKSSGVPASTSLSNSNADDEFSFDF